MTKDMPRRLLLRIKQQDYFEEEMFLAYRLFTKTGGPCIDVTGIPEHEQRFQQQEREEDEMSNQNQGVSVMAQGRIVWTSGDLFAGKIKVDPTTRQPKLNQQGEQIKEYGFGLAIPKAVLQMTGEGQPGQIWAAIHEEAYKLYPQARGNPAAMQAIGFAWKYKDGDGYDNRGRPFSDRPGYKDHLVFAMTTTLPIKFYRYDQGQNILINEGIKCGDFVNVQVQIKAHPAIGQGKPGLYLNPNAVQFLAWGEEIINTPDGDDIFGGGAPVVGQHLVGASTTPIAPQGFINPPGNAPAAPSYGAPPPAPGMPQMPTTPQAQQQPAPAHYGVLPQIHQPQGQPPMPGVPGAAPMGNAGTPQMSGAAPSTTYPMQQMQQQSAPAYPQSFGGQPPMPGAQVHQPMPGMMPQNTMPQTNGFVGGPPMPGYPQQ